MRFSQFLFLELFSRKLVLLIENSNEIQPKQKDDRDFGSEFDVQIGIDISFEF